MLIPSRILVNESSLESIDCAYLNHVSLAIAQISVVYPRIGANASPGFDAASHIPNDTKNIRYITRFLL